MKTRAYLLYIIILATCGITFALPFWIVGSASQTIVDPDLMIPNTGRGSPTATWSVERQLTIQAFATLFTTATNSPTSSVTPIPSRTPTSSPTITPSNTPTASPTPTRTLIPPTITNRPRDPEPTNPPPVNPPPSNVPPTSAPPTSPPPTVPPPTNPPPTNPPATNPPPTNPPPPTIGPIIPPIINTIIPPLFP